MTASQPLRFPVEPRDIPAEKAARRLHLTAAQFAEMLPSYLREAFPSPILLRACLISRPSTSGAAGVILTFS